jgi:2-keto-4-pentenoate hydratase/2-oxohepta-3-ene-1,7-dioic acid hydratase in catechol pathway
VTPFALGTFATSGEAFAGLVLGEHVLDLARRLGNGTSIWSLLQEWDASFARLQTLADEAGAEAGGDYPLAGLRSLPPVVPCGEVFQAGANYKQHLVELIGAGPERLHDTMTPAERAEALELLDVRARTGEPYIFIGSSHAVVGAEDDVVLPVNTKENDWELELAAVFGWHARNVPREHALEIVAGYTICNDVTARDRVFRPDIPGIGADWLASKNRPTFLPTGPYLVPSAHVGDPMALRLILTLNGAVMQDADTSDMMFDVSRLIEYLTSITDVRPGDMLLTGSPAGNGVHHGRFLRPGDVMESTITGLGRQRNRCVAAEPTTANVSTQLSV